MRFRGLPTTRVPDTEVASVSMLMWWYNHLGGGGTPGHLVRISVPHWDSHPFFFCNFHQVGVCPDVREFYENWV
jgi:hypothetical protein